MTGQTDWVSAVAILASGLILGLMFMYFFRRSKAVAPDPLQDLEAKRDALLRLIRSAEGEERQRLETEAANVLRQIDQRDDRRPRLSVSHAQAGQARRLSSTSPAAIGFVWGVVTTLAMVGLVFFVNRYSENRQQQPATAMQPAQPAADPALRNLEAAVQRQPEDLDMRIALARAYLERDNMMGVFEQTQVVLEKSPDDSRALTYQALVRMAMGDSASANEMLQRALKSDPKLLDAWVTLAWVQTQEGKTNEAEKTMREAMRRHPQEVARLQQILDQMKSHPPTTSETASARTPGVRITLESASPARGTIFVTARGAGVSAGPPVAAKRIDATSFPITLELTSSDSMMGQPLPATMRIEARLDSDGNAATRTAGEPSAVQDRVAAGSSITLRLK
jgi:cytochrome c-type biogenesis protein CcmH